MIRALKLKDFKCFEDLKDIETRQITLLTGSNGRGKSSVFQSLLLMAQSFRSGRNLETLKINGRFVCLGTFDDILRKECQCKTIEMSFTTDDLDENQIELTWAAADAKPKCADLKSFKVKYKDGKTKELVSMVGADNESSVQTIESVSSNSAVAALNQFSNFFYVSAERLGPTNYSVQDDVNGIGIHGEQIVNVLHEKGKSFIKEVAETISKIMGGASISIGDVDKEFLKLTMDSKDGSDNFKPVNVGFGYSYILPVVVIPLIAPNNAKIVIENPEAHLHPGAQSRLMNFIIAIAKEKGLQLFIETHSDHVINALRIATKEKKFGMQESDSCIIHLCRETDGNLKSTPIFIDREGNLSDYPTDFMEEWGNQMMYLV